MAGASRRFVVLLMSLGGISFVGCGGGGASVETAAPTETSGGEANAVSTSADAELAGLETESTAPSVVQADPRQGDVIDAGVIGRVQLQEVIAAGIPRFLQRVRTEPHKQGERFVGWRLLSIFDDNSFALGPLRIGDTVLGVNGRTIERPEQFFAVWETLGSASQITFQLLRGDQAYEVRYAIQD